MNRYKKLFSNTVILGIGTIGSKLLVFLLMPWYTLWLSTGQFGIAELITGTANLIIPIACVGITSGIFRFAAERESDKAAVFSSGLFLLAVGLGCFLVISPVLSLIGFLRGYVWLVILYVIAADLQALCAQYVRAVDRTRLFAVQGILNTVLTILLNVLFLALLQIDPVVGFVLSVIVGNFVTVVFLFVTARLWQVIDRSKIQKRMVKDLLWFSLPLIPTTVCWLITDLSDRYMLTYFQDSLVTGVYAAAYKIPTIVNIVSGIFMQAWQFSAVAESSDEVECRRFYDRVYSGFLSVIFIGSAGLILLSGFLTDLLLNASYGEASRYMPTLLCAAALEAVVSFFATVYLVRKKSMHSFLTALVGMTANVILNLILIPRAGGLGAAVATAVSYLLVAVVRMLDTRRMIRFRLFLPRFCVSVLLICIGAFLMTAEVKYGTLWCALTVLGVICINAPALLQGLGGLRSFHRASVREENSADVPSGEDSQRF